ncbi:hypothetical protein [Lysinibacillus sp. CTST325]
MLLSLRFRTEQSFLGASDEPLRFRVSGQHDIGHEGIITGCDGLSLRSSIADPHGVAQSPLQSTYTHDIRFNTMSSKSLGEELTCVMFRWEIQV